MNVVVKLFAGARDLANRDEVTLEIASSATVGDLRRQMLQQHPELQPLLTYAMFALDTTYCDDATPIPENANLACIPTVSGG